MSKDDILITENDLKRLQPLVEAVRFGKLKETWLADRLEKKLGHAKVVRSGQAPENVVTTNSWIQLLHLDSSEKTECWLRFPTDEASFPKAVSILTDLGIALLGSREGDVIEWSGPSGKRTSRIVEIMYQPERVGNTEL